MILGDSLCTIRARPILKKILSSLRLIQPCVPTATVLFSSIPSKQKENVLSSPNLKLGMISTPLFCNQQATALPQYVFHICITSGIFRYKLKSGEITPLNFFSLSKYCFGLFQSLSNSLSCS